MQYYRVINSFDQAIYWKSSKCKNCLYFGGFLIGGELYTEKELKRFDKVEFRNHLRIEQMVEPVEVSRKSVFWVFGARFNVNELLYEGQYKASARKEVK